MNDTENVASGQSPQGEQKAKREKANLARILPTDRIAFEKQVKILQAYAACYESNGGKPVSNKEAGDTVTPKFEASTLGVAVPFFVDIALLARNGSDFVPCPELVAYNKAVGLSLSEAKRKLRPIFENTWFYRLLVPKLQLNPLPIKECEGILAVEAKAEEKHLPRISPLINFLDLVGIVSVAGTTVSFVPGNGTPSSPEKRTPPTVNKQEDHANDESLHSYVLPLKDNRKVVVYAPLDIKQDEIPRIQKWIEFTLSLDWKEDKAK